MAAVAYEPMTVMVVDDHPLIQNGMGALLDAEPWVDKVLLASTKQDACRLAVNARPGLAVVDLGLPDSQGVELIEQLRRSVPECVVVVLTMTSDEAMVRRCLRAGARGYVLKDTRPDAVLRALAAVVEGAVVLGPRVRAEVLTARDVPVHAPPLDRLSPRELELLRRLGAGASNCEIARAMGVAEKTVRNRLSGIYVTVGVADRVQAALLAKDRGLLDHSEG